MKGDYFLISVVLTFNIGLSDGCESGWFGSQCQYKCHCQEPCYKDGSCPGLCDIGWFGHKCQYRNLLSTHFVFIRPDDDGYRKTLNDNNDTTCVQSTEDTLHLEATNSIGFLWLRIVTNTPELISNGLQITFEPKFEENLVPGDFIINGRNVDIHLPKSILKYNYKSLSFKGEVMKNICSLWLSGGRNINLKRQCENIWKSNYSQVNNSGYQNSNFKNSQVNETSIERSGSNVVNVKDNQSLEFTFNNTQNIVTSTEPFINNVSKINDTQETKSKGFNFNNTQDSVTSPEPFSNNVSKINDTHSHDINLNNTQDSVTSPEPFSNNVSKFNFTHSLDINFNNTQHSVTSPEPFSNNVSQINDTHSHDINFNSTQDHDTSSESSMFSLVNVTTSQESISKYISIGTSPEPSTSNYPEPSTSNYPEPSTKNYPEPPPSNYTEPSTNNYPEPSTSNYPEPSTSNYPEPYTSNYPEPSTSNYTEPSTSNYPEPYTSNYTEPSTSNYPEPSTSNYPETSTSNYTETSASNYTEPSTSNYREPYTSNYSEPSTSNYPEPYSSNYTEPSTSNPDYSPINTSPKLPHKNYNQVNDTQTSETNFTNNHISTSPEPPRDNYIQDSYTESLYPNFNYSQVNTSPKPSEIYDSQVNDTRFQEFDAFDRSTSISRNTSENTDPGNCNSNWTLLIEDFYIVQSVEIVYSYQGVIHHLELKWCELARNDSSSSCNSTRPLESISVLLNVGVTQTILEIRPKTQDFHIEINNVEIYADCAERKWGLDCENDCNSSCTSGCRQDDGLCSDCIGHFDPPRCQNDCVDGTYGINCLQMCPTNCTDRQCDKSHGACQKCSDGWYGRNCSLECPDSCIGQRCDRDSGACLGCLPGHEGIDCNKTCQLGSWGRNCESNCSQHCLHEDLCHVETGECHGGCKIGFQPPLCTTPSENTDAHIRTTEIPSGKIGACLAAQEYDVLFPETIAGGLSTVACSSRYSGTVYRLCNKGGYWEYPSFRDCSPISLQHLLPLLSRLDEQKNESNYRAQEAISNVTKSVFEYYRSIPKILSGDIRAMIQILVEMCIALNRHKLVVTNQLVELHIDHIDKVLTADAQEWSDLSKGVNTNNTSDQLLLSLEYLLQTFLISENNTDVTISTDYLDVTTQTQRNNPLIYPQANNRSFEDTDNEIIFYHSEHELFQYSIIVYKRIARKLSVKMFVDNRADRAQRPEPTDKLFNSDIISFSVVPNTKPESLGSKPVQITFKIYNTTAPKQICAYLWENNNESYWATHGCETETRGDNVTCRCSHLTNFAVLMSPFEPDATHASVLQFISTVGIAISLICLVVTITIYVIMWRYIKSDAIILHVNLSVSLFLGYIIFLLGVTRTHNSVTCAVVAVLLHYIFLVVFFVMLAQGLLVLKSVISLSSKPILKYLFPLMYGVPLIIVIVSVSVTGADGYGNAKMCWLDNSKGLLWAFAAPVCTVLLANFIVLIVVLRTMQTSHALMTKELNIKIKSIIRSICILSPILGITWAFGVLAISIEQVVFQYLFAISNSLQGLLIFLCQCILQHQVFDGLRAIIRRRRATRLDSTSKVTNTSMQDKVFSDSTLQRTTNSTETETLSKETVTYDEKSL